jgi:hypothetical protein
MEDLYSIHPGISRVVGGAASEASVAGAGAGGPSPSDLTELMKAQIASHPRYPSLLSAYIECRKVRAKSLATCTDLDPCFYFLRYIRGCVVVRAVSFLFSRWERIRM